MPVLDRRGLCHEIRSCVHASLVGGHQVEGKLIAGPVEPLSRAGADVEDRHVEGHVRHRNARSENNSVGELDVSQASW